MNDRERYVRCVLGEPVDRAPFLLMWGPWYRTWARWEKEGKPADVTNHRAGFGADGCPQIVPVNCGPCPHFEGAVLEETDGHVITVDRWGIVRRDLKSAESMPQFIEFPVKSRRDWEKYREERLNPDDERRVEAPWREHCHEWMSQGLPIQLGYYPDVGIFGSVRWLLGDEECLMAFNEDPDLVHEIMEHMTSIYLTVFEKVAREVQVDVVHIWEDMCFCNGPLISPAYWREFMGPQYRRIKEFTHAHGIPVLSVDTDGNPDAIAQPMIDHGVNLLFPMEVAARCDVNEWRRKYPQLGLLGGIDKRALALGPAAIDTELARIRPALESGRYMPDLDHLIPDNVSWDNYAYYARQLKELVYSTGVKG